uniref:Uncharacterized protein n=1 Tax=Avena sativa TaxID=4498 RepID=A0ACD5Y023_AVESA
MSVMLPILSSLLLVMAVGGVMHTNSVRAEETIVSNMARITAYWQTMLPNTPMPSAILDLLTTTHGNGHEGEGGHIDGGTRTKNDNQKLLIYGQVDKNENQQVRHSNGPITKNDNQNLIIYGKTEESHGQNLIIYGKSEKNVDQNLLIYGKTEKKYDEATKLNEQNLIIYGKSKKKDDQNLIIYGKPEKTDNQNLLIYAKLEKNDGGTIKSKVQDDGQEGEGGNIHGGITGAKNDDQKLQIYGQREKHEEQKVRHRYGPTTKNDDQNLLIYGKGEKNDGKTTKSNMQDEGEGGHMHGGIFFSEDSVAPGSTIAPHILPSLTSGASFLPRHVAGSIPISTRNFTDIMAMFAPVSHAMAADIWSALYVCEHPPVVKGETNTCILSVESMVEFVSSVLGGTQGLRAVSSPDVPADGIKSGKRYKVTALQRVTGAGDTVTCHSLRFPAALFMCHAVNPTRVYSVMMERECADDGAGIAGPERLEALAVCHLDTSDFDPAKMPGQFKPGEAPVCHFLASDNVLWASAAAVAA